MGSLGKMVCSFGSSRIFDLEEGGERERERERDMRDLNGGAGPLCGQVRVLVVGDSGVGKTLLVHLILKGSAIACPPQTIGCSVGVKHVTYESAGSSSNSINGDGERDFFVELGISQDTRDTTIANHFSLHKSMAAKEARYDKEAVIKFFRMLIRRRYFSYEQPAANPWSVPSLQNSTRQYSESLLDDDILNSSGETYKYDTVPPLPAQHNLTPPPTLYPQQPFSVAENYSFQRLSSSGLSETGSTRSKRSDINV